ncbi:MAG: DMT family transporter [Dongiaceae bacterium]
MTAATLRLDRVPPTVLLLLAVISIQLGSALAITLFPIYGPLGVLFLRLAIGSAFLCLIYRNALGAAIRKAPLGIAGLGLVMAAQSGLHYEALSRLPLGIAVSIEFLGPLALAMATSRRLQHLLCVLMAAAGIALLTPAIGTTLDPVGVAFAAGAASAWVGYILASQRLGRTLEGGVAVGIGMGFAALLVFPIAGIEAIAQLAAHPATLLSIVGIAVFSAAIPWLFEYMALKSLPAWKFGVLVSLEPVVATLVGLVALAEAVGWRAWIAILLITLASIGVALSGRRKAQRG